MLFDFATAQRIVFGPGRLAELGAHARALGSRAALVTGGRSLEDSGTRAHVEDLLRREGIDALAIAVHGEPTIGTVDAAAISARQFRAEMVIAAGGGSALDTGKAIAALAANGGEALDYLEGVGRGRPLAARALPVIAIPTTAGTGSEVTKNAVIGDAAHTFKKSMRSETMLPALALVDPELTWTCPREVTAACGMDALTQLLESFVSSRSGPLTDALAREGLGAARALERLIDDGDNHAARERMALASLLGGICLANAGLGAVHGLAAPLGSFFPIAHGAICAALLPAALRANGARARKEGRAELLAKFEEAARWLTSEPLAPEALSARLKQWQSRAGLKGLRGLGVAREDFTRIVADARGNSMKTNPVMLDDAELTAILEESL